MQQKKVSGVVTGLKGRCPHCGRGKLFKGFIGVRDKCSVCGLNFDFVDSGDGPAIFIMFIVGFIIIPAIIATEIWFRPPYWVHALLWGPGVLLLSAGLLRPLKGVLIALQYKHQAHEGQIDQ